jgi:hypothetical protein
MLRCMSPQDKNRRSRHGKFTPRHDGWRVRSGHAFASLRQANAGALLVSGDPFFSSRRQPPPARAPGGPFLIESAILSFPLQPLRPHNARTRARTWHLRGFAPISDDSRHRLGPADTTSPSHDVRRPGSCWAEPLISYDVTLHLAFQGSFFSPFRSAREEHEIPGRQRRKRELLPLFTRSLLLIIWLM